MTALALTITTAGLGRFTSAQAGEDIDLTVARVGVTASQFVAAPTLTALPGEIKRLDTVSGEALPNSIVHMTLRDLSADTYSVRGFGLYLADGTLFAVHGQPGVIVEKSTVSTILLALDIKFPTGDVSLIQFGDANFAYPPATIDRKGVAELATQAEVDAGDDAERIVTPKTLKARLAGIVDAIAGKVAGTRQIAGAGLATGGGDLTADRTITVTGASAAEADAGTSTTKALTPASLTNILAAIAARVVSTRQILAGGLATGGGTLAADRTITVSKAGGADILAGSDDGLAITPAGLRAAMTSWGNAAAGGRRNADGSIEQWGNGVAGADGSFDVVFPLAFPNAVYGAIASNNAGGPPAAFAGCGATTLTGMKVWQAGAALTAAPGAAATWRAWGK